MKTFITMLSYMGMISLPEMNMHWKNNSIIKSTKISEVMARDKFFLILQFLQLNNSAYDDGTDKIYKFRPFSEKLI
jgi:hypothetical protein